MLLVISPAKNLDFDTPVPPCKHTKCAMLEAAEVLIGELKPLAPQEISTLMGVSDKLAVLNYDRFQQWQLPFTTKNARPAVFAFNGDVYQGLDIQSFDTEAVAFAQDRLRILSGLYGVLRPLDLIQPYRLEMGAKFTNSRGANLYAFWGESITELLNKQLKKLEASVLLNLASNEYFKSVKVKQLHGDVITPVFKDWKNGNYKIISFFAKKARGLMAAYVLKNQLKDVEGIKKFNVDGYSYNEAMSSAQEWVFTRRI